MTGSYKYLKEDRVPESEKAGSAKAAKFGKYVQQYEAGCTWEQSTKYLRRSASSSSNSSRTGSGSSTSSSSSSSGTYGSDASTSSSSSTKSMPPAACKRKRESPTTKEVGQSVDKMQRSDKEADELKAGKAKRTKKQRKK